MKIKSLKKLEKAQKIVGAVSKSYEEYFRLMARLDLSDLSSKYDDLAPEEIYDDLKQKEPYPADFSKPVLPFDECCPDDFRAFLTKHEILEAFKKAVDPTLFSTHVRLSEHRSDRHRQVFIGGSIVDLSAHRDVDWKKYHNMWIDELVQCQMKKETHPLAHGTPGVGETDDEVRANEFNQICPDDFRAFLDQYGIVEDFIKASDMTLFRYQVEASLSRSPKHRTTFLGGTIEFKKHTNRNWRQYDDLWNVYLNTERKKYPNYNKFCSEITSTQKVVMSTANKLGVELTPENLGELYLLTQHVPNPDL